MEHSPQEHVETEASAEAAGPEGAAAPEGFRLGFVIPQFLFALPNLAKLKRQVRAVMKQAMIETNQSVQDGPVGMRVHLQFDVTKLTEAQQADARAGRKLPPANPIHVTSLFVGAAHGLIVTDQTKLVQFLITTGWGATDAVQISAWEIDLGRKEGV